MPFIVILSTASSRKEAQKIAKALLDDKLAACVNIIDGAESHFQWQGKREKASELLLIIKTRKALYAKVEKMIQKLHSYDVPEVLAMPVTAGSKSYLSWLGKETRSH